MSVRARWARLSIDRLIVRGKKKARQRWLCEEWDAARMDDYMASAGVRAALPRLLRVDGARKYSARSNPVLLCTFAFDDGEKQLWLGSAVLWTRPPYRTHVRAARERFLQT